MLKLGCRVFLIRGINVKTEIIIYLFVMIFAFSGGIVAMYFAMRKGQKPAKKLRTPWLTAHQLTILDVIGQHGRGGLPLWETNINLATIRSLAKRGFCDTASRGRIVITRAGRKRLLEPWPAEQPTGDQKDRADASGSGAAQNAPTGSQAASEQAG